MVTRSIRAAVVSQTVEAHHSPHLPNVGRVVEDPRAAMCLRYGALQNPELDPVPKAHDRRAGKSCGVSAG